MDLILWRHAEALELRDGSEIGDDLARPLTPKGERQAQRMATWLNRHLTAGTRILASPARRTQQTAQALDRRFKTVPALAPDGTVEGLLAVARWPGSREPVLVVGHQPTLGMTAGYLLTGDAQPWPLRKGALIWLRARERDGKTQVVLHGAMAPDLL
ncbi:MAG: histidine phosphatase family protein [Rubrivivax sp.]|nr:histidine phosphatase family protein [Rubrivivax sp.]MDH5340677.1 histidine phosphatase family protein [Rubrivivax sp.]